MKIQFWQIAILILMLALVFSACGTATETEIVETTIPTETIVETTEPEIEPDPEWLTDAAIDEAYACMFPLDGEKNVELAQEILLPLVEAGNAEAQYYWGYIYDWEIVDNNGDEEKESLYWYELAAEQGFSKAYLAASLNIYIESEERADEMVELATQAGLFEMTPEELGADGCEMIGAYYYSTEDYNSALEWFTKAADMGSTVSMYYIGDMYYSGAGVKQDIGASLDWLLKAANLGNVYAMNYYAYVLFETDYSDELVEQKYEAAFDAYMKAAEAGDPVAMYNIGHIYESKGGPIGSGYFDAVLEWYLKAADLGDAYAMCRLGDIYCDGIHVAQDYEAALEWYQKAADLGNVNAMLELSYMLEQGIGAERDTVKAQEWLQKAIEADQKSSLENNDGDGHIDFYSDTSAIRDAAFELLRRAVAAGYSDAMNNIGFYGYSDGWIYADDDVAIKWCKKAADAGNTVSMLNLGYLYKDSNADGNYDAAMEWFMRAYGNGNEIAAEQINEMLSNKQGVNAFFENYGELINANIN